MTTMHVTETNVSTPVLVYEFQPKNHKQEKLKMENHNIKIKSDLDFSVIMMYKERRENLQNSCKNFFFVQRYFQLRRKCLRYCIKVYY